MERVAEEISSRRVDLRALTELVTHARDELQRLVSTLLSNGFDPVDVELNLREQLGRLAQMIDDIHS